MSEISHPMSNDSNTPFVDEETPFKIRLGTLRKIIGFSILGALAAGGWAVNIKMAISSQEERSKRIEVRVESLDEVAKKQTEAMFEQKTKLLLIDQKLDNIASRQATPR